MSNDSSGNNSDPTKITPVTNTETAIAENEDAVDVPVVPVAATVEAPPVVDIPSATERAQAPPPATAAAAAGEEKNKKAKEEDSLFDDDCPCCVVT